jgi:hypothetical protein
MKKLLPFLFAIGSAFAGTGSWTGWISDESCGAGNANGTQESRECAARCIKNGSAAVFVADKDQKVFKLTGKVDPTQHLAYKVKITGEMKGDSIAVAKIEKAQ